MNPYSPLPRRRLNHARYDALNRIAGKLYGQQNCPLTSPTIAYLYDQTSFNGLTITNGIGRRTGMSDLAGAEAWSYDVAGRPVTDRRSIGSVTKNTSYAYNLIGSATSVTYPSGRKITYAYNTNAQATSAADSPNSINYATLATYSPSGRLTSLKNGTNLTSTLFYNTRLQPCRISVTTGTTNPANCGDTSQVGNALDFTYNFGLGAGDNGNVMQIVNNRDSARTQSFTYDALNRINTAQTSVTTGTKCFGESFGVDAWGNLLNLGGVSGYSSCTQENLSAIASVQNQINSNTYDAAGNALVTGYTYDAENHLLTAGGVTYTYDGDGKRVKKSSGKVYWFGMDSDPLDETDLTGSTTNGTFNEYAFFGGKRVARRNSSSAVFYYFADHLGTSRVIVQAGQTSPCYDADFYPFGGERTPVNNTCPQNYKFTGKERDSESGLDYFGARYYRNALGRFISPDQPFADEEEGDPQSWNLYAYAGNNPLRYVDPDGQSHLDKNGYRVGDYDEECINGGSLCWDAKNKQWDAPHVPPHLASGAASPLFLGPFDIFVLGRLPGGTAASAAERTAARLAAETAAKAAAEAAAKAAAEAALKREVSELIGKAVSAVGNQGVQATSREAAEKAAAEWVGAGARNIVDRQTGQVVGQISADGSKIARFTSVGKAQPYINLVNKTTGGNLHVRF